MYFDFSKHKSVIVVDNELPIGLAMNTVSIVGVSLGRLVTNLVGPDLISKDNVNYSGVVYTPLPILASCRNTLSDIFAHFKEEEHCIVMPFSRLAQSCKTYLEYEDKISNADSFKIELSGIGIVGPKKLINKFTGNLPLYK